MTMVQALKDLGEQMGLKVTDLKEKQRLFEEKQKHVEIAQKEGEHKYIMEQKAQEMIPKAKERDHEYLLKKMEYEIQMKKATIVKGEHEDDDDDDGDLATTGHTNKEYSAKGKMPCFDDRVHDMDAFLHRFEVYADSQVGKKTNAQYICQHF